MPLAVTSKDTIMQKILDPMSGARMFYFDKNNRSVLFGDKKPAANKAGTNRFFLVFFKDE